MPCSGRTSCAHAGRRSGQIFIFTAACRCPAVALNEEAFKTQTPMQKLQSCKNNHHTQLHTPMAFPDAPISEAMAKQHNDAMTLSLRAVALLCASAQHNARASLGTIHGVRTSSVSPMAELRFLYGRSPVAKPLCAKAAISSSRSMLPLGRWAACIRLDSQAGTTKP